jgi:hypothetical protein
MMRSLPARAGLLAATGAALFVAAPVPAALAAQVTIDVPGCTTSLTPTVSGSIVTLTCGTTPPPNPSVSCASASATPSTIPQSGGTVTLGSSCTSTTGATLTYSWTRNGTTLNVVASSGTDTLAANTATTANNYTYTVRACDASNNCASVSAASVSQPGQTVPGTGWPVTCSGYSNTVAIDLPWPTQLVHPRFSTATYGNFGSNSAMVIRISPPAGAYSPSSGYLMMYEWINGVNNRFAHLSTTPCDFTSTANWGADTFAGVGLRPDVYVGRAAPSFFGQTYGMSLTGGTTYYLNVRNADSATGTGHCDDPSGTCTMFIEFQKPPGT